MPMHTHRGHFLTTISLLEAGSEEVVVSALPCNVSVVLLVALQCRASLGTSKASDPLSLRACACSQSGQHL